jgi:hypothetical protein
MEEAAEEKAVEALRRANQDAAAVADAHHQLDLTGHEQALQVSEFSLRVSGFAQLGHWRFCYIFYSTPS